MLGWIEQTLEKSHIGKIKKRAKKKRVSAREKPLFIHTAFTFRLGENLGCQGIIKEVESEITKKQSFEVTGVEVPRA